MKKKKPSLVSKMRTHLRHIGKEGVDEDHRREHIEDLKRCVEMMKEGKHQDQMRKIVNEL